MGSDVIAECQCGLKTNIMIGGGMMNFMDTCYFPCLCQSCQDVVEVNLLAKEASCPKCKTTEVIPYDDPSLSEGEEGYIVAGWNMEEALGRKLSLTSKNYKCPQCGQMTLRFEKGGLCWD